MKNVGMPMKIANIVTYMMPNVAPVRAIANQVVAAKDSVANENWLKVRV